MLINYDKIIALVCKRNNIPNTFYEQGRGGCGSAFSSADKKYIIKITGDNSEMGAYQIQLNSENAIESLPYVYDLFYAGSSMIGVCLKEFIEPLPEHIKRELDELDDQTNGAYMMDAGSAWGEEIEEILSDHTRELLYDLWDELECFGIAPNDTLPYNLGMRNDKLVFFDPGYSSIIYEDIPVITIP